jgi:hypothetical protein
MTNAMTFHILSQAHLTTTEDKKGVEIMSNLAIAEAHQAQCLVYRLI